MSSTQTMKHWAIKVTDIQELPVYFQADADDLLKYYKGEASVIYAPSKDHNDAVLILLDQEVVVLEKKEQEVMTVRFPMEGIQLVQMGSVLLDSWLKVCGKTARSHKCETVYFNTVMDALFEPVMETLRRKMLNLGDTEMPAAAEQLAELKDTSLKFYNYATMNLLPGQRVLAYAFQPGVALSFWKRSISADKETEPHLLVLTERELILIKETAQKKKSATQKYSGIWSYMPLNQVATIDLAPLEEGWGGLTIQLEGQKDLTLLYQQEHMGQAQHLIDALISNKQRGV